MNIIQCLLGKKYVLRVLCIVLGVATILPMDLPQQEKEYVFVKTSDGEIIPVERWQIGQMKTLLVLLEHQRSENSYANPLNASIITSEELQSLTVALTALARKNFEQFYMDLAQSDGLLEGEVPKINYTLGEGKLRALVNVAERVEAQGLVALCGSYYLPKDMQRLLVPQIIDPIIPFLQERVADAASFSIAANFDSNVCAFSPDSTKIYVKNREGKIEVWDLSTRKLLKIFDVPACEVRSIALSSDGQLCAAGGFKKLQDFVSDSQNAQNRIFVDQKAEIVIWNTISGELVKNYPFNWANSSISSLDFSPINNNQIVFSCYKKPINTVCLLDIETGIITDLIGNKKGIDRVSFSSDGSTILGVSFEKNTVALWDVVSNNLIMEIPKSSDSYAMTGASFYGNNREIIISELRHAYPDPNRDRRLLRVVDINNSSYEQNTFGLDKFFPEKFGELQLRSSDFFVQPNGDISQIALCGRYMQRNYPHQFLLVVSDGQFNKVFFNKYFPKDSIMGVRWSNDKKWIAISKFLTGGLYEIMLIPLIFDKLFNLSIAQARLLYQLCCARLSGFSVVKEDFFGGNGVFMQLPGALQEILLKSLLYEIPVDQKSSIKKEEQECNGNKCIIS